MSTNSNTNVSSTPSTESQTSQTSQTSVSSSIASSISSSSNSILSYVSGKTVHIGIEILLYSITVYYFYKKIRDLTSLIHSLERKIAEYDKVNDENKQLSKKMTEISQNSLQQMSPQQINQQIHHQIQSAM